MWILNISSRLLIFVLITSTKAQADSTACEMKENLLAALDLAKDAISKAKDIQPTCVDDSEDVSSNSKECGGDAKVSAYLDFALNLIDNAKANYSTCDVAKDLTKVVTDEPKDVTKIVTDEPKDVTKVVTDEQKDVTQVVTDEPKDVTQVVTDEPKDVTQVVTDEPKDVTKIVLHTKPIDCSEVLKNGETKSGEYTIWPKNPQFENLQLKVYCDMETDGGGWTVIQRRGQFSNKVDFFRNWSEYKQGFGNISEEFWIGNDNIFALTNQRIYTVRFDMENVDKEHRYATYFRFWIEDERATYKLHFDEYSGTAGDGFQKQRNMKFATKDKENGKSFFTKCAKARNGGWWYENCGLCNPNGINFPGGKNKRNYMTWRPFTEYDSLLTIEIKIR